MEINKHEDIGATVLIWQECIKYPAKENMLDAVARLFRQEAAEMCDYLEDNRCYMAGPKDPGPCAVSNCPLGILAGPKMDAVLQEHDTLLGDKEV